MEVSVPACPVIILEAADVFDVQAPSWGATEILRNYTLSSTHIPQKILS